MGGKTLPEYGCYPSHLVRNLPRRDKMEGPLEAGGGWRLGIGVGRESRRGTATCLAWRKKESRKRRGLIHRETRGSTGEYYIKRRS